MKVLPFKVNYDRELRIGVNIRRKGKVKKATKFVERIKKVQKEVRAVLQRAQEEMEKQADKG